MASVGDDITSIPVHKPNLRENLFFLISGMIISVPLTLFINSFARSFCIDLPIFYATMCSAAILAPVIEEFAKAFMSFDAELKEIHELKPIFRLRPPKKGYEREGIKKPFSVGGALGYRKDKINELLEKMI